MKFLFISLALMSSAFAANTRFAGCFGDHHGTYIDFKTTTQGVAYLETSNDSDAPAEKYTIVSVMKSAAALKPVAYSWAIRQAIKSSEGRDGAYGMLIVKATKGNRTLFVQLNKFLNSENYLSSEGYVEKLTCPVTLIRE